MLSVGIGGFAGTRGRSVIFWAFISLLITPIVAAGILLILKDKNPRRAPREEQKAESQ
ncbi:hypothetical protein MWH30_03920 [Fuchsiella alkaliacetigena]|nr:hypothetical protein [Fuchsiella alkaliacetigena]